MQEMNSIHGESLVEEIRNELVEIDAMEIKVVPGFPAQGRHDVARHAGPGRDEATLDRGVEKQGRRGAAAGGVAAEDAGRDLFDQGGLLGRRLGGVDLTHPPTQQGAQGADDQTQERLGERKQFHSRKQKQAGWAGKPKQG